MDNKEKALVTGASGFIGQHLCNTLRKEGYEVATLTHELLYDPIRLSQELQLFQPEYIFHLAAYGNMAKHTDVAKIVNANITALFNLLMSSLSIDYKGFVNVSSSSVALDYETLYSATKAGGERICKSFVDEYGKPIVSLRPYSVYGEGEAEHRLIPTIFKSCLTNEPMVLSPHSTHDWVYVEDFVNEMITCALVAEKIKGKAIGFGSGKKHTNEQVVSLVERITGRKAVIAERKALRSFDTTNWVAKDEDDLSATQLQEGLENTYKYYKQIYEE